MHMLNAALMSAKQPPLEKRCDGVDAWHRHVSRIGAGADHGDLMLVPGGGQPGIPTPAVGVDRSARHRGGLNEGQQACARHVLDAAKTNPADAIAILFGGDRDNGLGLGLPAALASFHTADIGLVHLYRAAERVPSGADHRPAQLVQPGPGRLVAAEAENTLQPQSADAVLLVGDIPHRHEPHSQRLSGVLKDCPGRQRRLPLAPLAVQQPPRRHPRLARPPAMRAYEPTRPAQAPDIFAAGGVAAEPLVNLLKRPGIINPRDKISGVLHPSKAITRTNWSEADTLFSRNAPSRLSDVDGLEVGVLPRHHVALLRRLQAGDQRAAPGRSMPENGPGRARVRPKLAIPARSSGRSITARPPLPRQSRLMRPKQLTPKGFGRQRDREGQPGDTAARESSSGPERRDPMKIAFMALVVGARLLQTPLTQGGHHGRGGV